MREKFWVGIDIGGTKTAVSLSRKLPNLIDRVEFPTRPARGPEPALERIKSVLRSLLSRHGVTAGDIRGLGVSCGGPLDPVQGIIQSPPNLQTWKDIPVKSILEREFGAPCRVENDANAGAVAEHRYGAGRGCHNMVFLTMGTGFGAGIIIAGRLYRGASESAGEIGHVRLTRSGPVGYHKAGSVEGWVSGGGVAQVARRAAARARQIGVKTLLINDLRENQEITARDVGDAAQRGDSLARSIITATGRRLGEALAILVDILNPERMVIGGLALRWGAWLLDPARKTMKKEALQGSAEACQVVPAGLGEHIGDVAALCVARGLPSLPSRRESAQAPRQNRR